MINGLYSNYIDAVDATTVIFGSEMIYNIGY